MRLVHALPWVAASTAFIVPDEQVLKELTVESHQVVETAKNVLDDVVAATNKAANGFIDKIRLNYVSSWLRSENELPELSIADDHHEHPHPPHNPHHPHEPHNPHDPHKANKTIYEMIVESQYTTKLAKYIKDDEELVNLFNSTDANFTVFTPIDCAFDKIPDDAPEPSKEEIRKILSYHVSPELYPARRIIGAPTIPTMLKEEELASPKGAPQRLRVGLSLRGLTVNYYVRVVAANIYATNGVIHAVDKIILPPPRILKIVDLFPSEFSTLELGLLKTGLLDTLKETSHAGATFFAPSNYAFKKLGPRVNAFLFSKYGQKYLKALLKYHVVLDQTLYSNAFYKSEPEDVLDHQGGYFHVDLPTLLEGHSLGVDIASYGPFKFIKVNGFVSVTAADGIAKDGVIHVISNVLIPPKRPGESSKSEDFTVEELKERLEPYLSESKPEL